jgi:hypothetical protein
MGENGELWGYTIFSDDLRLEHDGRRSLMGVFIGNMSIAGDFPMIIPKFAASIVVYEPLDAANSRVDEIKLAISFPGETFETASIQGQISPAPKEAIENIRNAPTYSSDEPLYVRIDMFFVAAVNIQEAGWIRVRGRQNGQILKLGSLRVDHLAL